MTDTPHPHWILRARLAHDRLTTSDGQPETDRERLEAEHDRT
jgi:hypothetical protein